MVQYLNNPTDWDAAINLRVDHVPFVRISRVKETRSTLIIAEPLEQRDIALGAEDNAKFDVFNDLFRATNESSCQNESFYTVAVK